jgi:hypothetical protein
MELHSRSLRSFLVVFLVDSEITNELQGVKNPDGQFSHTGVPSTD